ncbi:MAG: matrixin family metalloprotease [Planctomycetes bacterium]|nr:matrixin family metalloprotease [Planctomycetota bacterium]
MNHLLRTSCGILLIGGAVTLALPQEATAWSTIGGNLSLSQRDFRIYDDFTDATAHDNTTAHPNWPGYTEIELAAWKAGAEWNARALGDGSGDGTQSVVGDGGANFSFVWNGEASAVGGFNGNIISPITGSSGGVLAYCETPISDGWRVRAYESWTWDDGPNSVSGSRMDFQGIICHELGHALGLGHSTASGSPTMYAYALGNGVANRSIENDDRNGLKSGIYGAMSSSMPEITGLQGSLNGGGTCIVVGNNFSTSDNEVWLNSDELNAAQSGGEPVKITGLSSTNGGTQIAFTVPTSGIEAGEIHVKKSGSGHSTLSEGHPFDYGGGQPGLNTIQLTGSSTAIPGWPAYFDFTQAGASTTVYMLRSFTNTGSTISGHSFDIGAPWAIVTSVQSDASGTGSFNLTVPSGASGLSVYLELGCMDASGAVLDSNPLFVTVL